MKSLTLPTLIFCAVITFLAGCKTERQATFQAKGIDYQYFEIDANRDTIIQLESDALLQIKKNSFLGVKRNVVKLRLQEVRTMDQILRSRISTLRTDGRPLSTFYMINLVIEDKVTIDPKAPLRMIVPAKTMLPEIVVYRGEEQNDNIAWTQTDTILQQPVLDRIAEGRKLFREHCETCHSANLCDKLTGPPLACIEGDDTETVEAWPLLAVSGLLHLQKTHRQ